MLVVSAQVQQKLANAEAQVLKEAKVVATTYASAVSSSRLEALRTTSWDAVVVDEASTLQVSSLAWLSTLATKSFTVVGDFLQNGPITLLPKSSASYNIQAIDIFTTLGISPHAFNPQPGRRQITTQRRFPQQVATLLNTFAYSNVLETVYQKPTDQCPITVVDVKDLPQEFLQVHAPAGKKAGAWLAGSSLATYIATELAAEGSLGVVVPYGAQEDLTRQSILSQNRAAEVGTSHKFQGREFDTVIFDTVEPRGHQGWVKQASFLKDPTSWEFSGARLANVAVSRTKGKLYIVTDTRILGTATKGSFCEALAGAINTGVCEVVNANTLLSGEAVEEEQIYTYLETPTTVGLAPAPATLPVFYSRAVFYQTLPQLLESAQRSIHIFSPFITAPRMKKVFPLLQKAQARGVQVAIWCKPPQEIGKDYMNSELFLNYLVHKGFTVYTKHGLHEKALMLDGQRCFVGSLNMLSATDRTSEIMVGLEGVAAVNSLTKQLGFAEKSTLWRGAN